jgi:translation initiation factor 2 beta subunit (eIF-2beta)/eIF-5
MKIILIIFALAILGILIYTLVSVVSVNKKIKELDTKTGEARIKSLIDKFTEKQQERDVSTDSQDIQANNINVRENLTSRNIDVSENLSADTITTSGKFIANELEANNINVIDNTNVKNLNISGNIFSNDLIEKIKEHSDKYVRYLEVNLTDQELYNKDKFYPLVFAARNSGQIKVVEFTISSYSGMLQLTNPSSLEKTINQNLLKFTGQGGGWDADRSFGEIFYTYHSDNRPTGSTSSNPARTYGPIVSPMEKMGTLIDIAENKGVPISVCLYVRGCNRYYIRTNADSVELMDKGGRIDDIDGCFINILELKTTDGVHQLVDENTKELPTYNTELKTNNTTENVNPGLELFWNGISAGRGKFFYSEVFRNNGIITDAGIVDFGDMYIKGNISNNQSINLNYGSEFKSVKLDASNIPANNLVELYKCTTAPNTTTILCDTNLSGIVATTNVPATLPTVFKSIKFDSVTVTKPKLSGLTYSNNNVNGILTVSKTGSYEIDMNLLFFVIINSSFGTAKLNRLQAPPAVTVKLADITSFRETNAITSSSPTVLEEFICIINNSFTIDDICTSTSTVPRINDDCRIFSGNLRDNRVVNLTAGKSYSFIILRPNSDVYKLRYRTGNDLLNNDRGLFLHKVSNINIKLLSY